MRDFYLAGLIGLAVGLLILPLLANIGQLPQFGFSLAIVAGFTFLGPAAFAIFRLLAHFQPSFEKIGKFAAVGTLNTFLDLGAVNIFILITGIAAGRTFVIFKVAGFLLAATNSYFWNKFWTFQSRSPASWREYSLFGVFTLAGAFVNATVASLIVNGLGAPAGFSQEIWANIGAAAATAFSLVLNFFLYKKWVFGRQ